MHHCHEQVFEAATLSSFFILGLLGSTHCLGMCGPLTCFVFGKTPSKSSVFQYHFFRILSYSAVSLILSIIGGLTLKNMIWNRFSNFLFWFIIAFVILQLVFQLVGKKLKNQFPKMTSSPYLPMIVGSVTGLLPCGLLIPAYIAAASMPSKLMVLFSIFLFFLGTLPALLASQSLFAKLRKILPPSLLPWLNPTMGVIFLLVQVWMISK